MSIIYRLHDIIENILSQGGKIFVVGLAISWSFFLLVLLTGISLSFMKSYEEELYKYLPEMRISARSDKQESSFLFEEEDAFIAGIEVVAPIVESVETSKSRSCVLESDGKKLNIELIGVSDKSPSILRAEIVRGRLFTGNEGISMQKVAVINITADNDNNVKGLLGRYVSIAGNSFLVVGVVDDYVNKSQVYIPSSVYGVLFDSHESEGLVITLASKIRVSDIPVLKNSVANALVHKHGLRGEGGNYLKIDDYYSDIMQVRQVGGTITLVLTVLILLSLVSACVGLSNITSISLLERSREIGIRKALGATDRNLITMALSESVIVALVFAFIGGIIGLLSNLLVDRYIPLFIPQISGISLFSFDASFIVTLMTLIISVIAGIASGLVPVRRMIKKTAREIVSG